jgi:uncharacterized Zn finger protein (UPF0148 family)
MSEEVRPCPKCGGFMFKEQGEAVTWFCPACNVKYKTE